MRRRVGTITAAGTVVASMIGAGGFTTTGFMVADVGSAPAILLGWLAMGVASLAGAACYAELGATYPRNGGEYYLLGRIYHPALGFVAGWVSLFVGFSAPTAAAALAFGRYLGVVVGDPIDGRWVASALILAAAVLHAVKVRVGGTVQDAITGAQVLGILGFLGLAAAWGDPSHLATEVPLGQALTSPALAVGLIYVSFAYSGWNAASYLAGEVVDPARTLPRALLLGTLATTLLYVGLNVAFLISAPPEQLAGKVEVGHVAAVALGGEGAGQALGLIIALGLAASVSALLLTGSRVIEAVGRDHRALAVLSNRLGGEGGPAVALGLQAVLALAMVWTAAFSALLVWIGFVLSVFAVLTVVGVAVSRYRHPDLPRPVRAWGWPITPLLFLVPTLWGIVWTIIERPATALAAAAAVGLGGVLYLAVGTRPDEGEVSAPPAP
jgi:APA family basic amino acid/polyamine antiporter